MSTNIVNNHVNHRRSSITILHCLSSLCLLLLYTFQSATSLSAFVPACFAYDLGFSARFAFISFVTNALKYSIDGRSDVFCQFTFATAAAEDESAESASSIEREAVATSRAEFNSR